MVSLGMENLETAAEDYRGACRELLAAQNGVLNCQIDLQVAKEYANNVRREVDKTKGKLLRLVAESAVLEEIEDVAYDIRRNGL